MKHLLQNDSREALKVTMTGLKVFERQELKVSAPSCSSYICVHSFTFLLRGAMLSQLAFSLHRQLKQAYLSVVWAS